MKKETNRAKAIKCSIILFLIVASVYLLIFLAGNALNLFVFKKSVDTDPNDTGIFPNNAPGFDWDNYALENVTDEQIIYLETAYKAFFNVEKHGGQTSGVYKCKTDKTRTSFSSKKINGVATVSTTKVENATLELEIESTHNSGKMKIAIVMDEEIVEYVEVGEKVSLSYNVTGKHFYKVKIVCENANMSIKVVRKITETQGG